MYKIYINGNRFLIQDLNDNRLYEGLSKNVLLRQTDTTSTVIAFTGVNNWEVRKTLDFTTDVDLTGAPYSDFATFVTWCDNELGKSSPQGGGNVKEIYKLTDLPKEDNGVITLEPDTAYKIYAKDLDLLGSRLVGQSNTAILGSTSETSDITSTGLGVGIPLFSTSYTTPIQNITFKNINTAISITGDINSAFDWDKFNIINCPNIGNVNTCSNWILTNSAFLNSKGLKFDGEVGTIGISNSLFVGDGLSGSVIEVLSTANITRRFRPIYSSFVVFGSTIGINFDISATVLTESYILDTVNFSGGGTYQTGVLNDSNKSLFVNCVGITNTSVNGQLYMRNNATTTTISDTVSFFKILGTTTPSPDNSKYEHSNNRLTCKAVIERKYLITCTLSFTTSNNNVCQFGFYDSKLLGIREPSITIATANSAGRQEGVTFSCVVQHGFDNYLEVFCKNTTGANDITVTDMNFIIVETK